MPRVFAIFATIGLTIITALNCYPQEKLRTIVGPDPSIAEKNAPVDLVRSEFSGKSLTKGEQFRAGADWLPKATFGFKNTSAKTVVFLMVDLLIDRTDKSMPEADKISIPLYFGSPKAPVESRRNPDGSIALAVKPGDTVMLSVAESEMQMWNKTLVQYGVDDFDRVTIRVRHVHFDDGTGWAMGFEVKQDSDNPSRWSVVKRNKTGAASTLRNRLSRWANTVFSSSGLSQSPLMIATVLPTGSRLFFRTSRRAAPP